ncbi:hypothetical protein J6590_038112 [Homalodisca vitripennis]|nr:hypothetical protein J6590_038112 [Homalodisca vitripennis]
MKDRTGASSFENSFINEESTPKKSRYLKMWSLSDDFTALSEAASSPGQTQSSSQGRRH